MSYFYFGIFSVALGFYIYKRYTKDQIVTTVTRAIGYGSIYFDRLKKNLINTNTTRIISDINYGKIREVKYKQNENIYYLVSNIDDNLEVPVYKDTDFINNRSFTITSESIILVTPKNIDGNEVTLQDNHEIDTNILLDTVKMYSGPKGNFYADTNLNNEGFRNTIKQRILDRINASNLNIDFEIMYSNGDIKLI